MTPDTDGGLAERLAHVFDAPEPSTGIDPRRLLEAGRRIKRQRRRKRQLAGSSASLACLLLAAGGLAVATPHPTGPDTSTITIGDPLTLQGDFTWLPGPTKWIQYSGGTSRGFDSVEQSWTDERKVLVSETLTWNVTPTPAGLKDIGTVNGRTAYSASGALYFKSPTGQWAELTAYAFPTDKSAADFDYVPAATELEIARAVRFASKEIALPIRVADDAAKPSEITFSTQGVGDWSLELRYSEGTTDFTLDVEPGNPGPEEEKGGLDYYIATHTFKDGYKVSDGLGINLDMATPQGTAPGDPEAYLSRITSLGLDPADWTTRPIVN